MVPGKKRCHSNSGKRRGQSEGAGSEGAGSEGAGGTLPPMKTTITLDKGGWLVIPKPIRRQMHLREGSRPSVAVVRELARFGSLRQPCSHRVQIPGVAFSYHQR